MICYQFKGGIGTASRVVKLSQEIDAAYTVGVLVQANFGGRRQVRVAGVPVGMEISDIMPVATNRLQITSEAVGSIIIVVATDAPLLPHQLKRMARRAALGMARTGGTAGNGSGDIFVAFSTANAGAVDSSGPVAVNMLPNGRMSPLFDATVQATEEAIINALIAAETMTGVDNHTVYALPHDRLKNLLQKYHRLSP